MKKTFVVFLMLFFAVSLAIGGLKLKAVKADNATIINDVSISGFKKPVLGKNVYIDYAEKGSDYYQTNCYFEVPSGSHYKARLDKINGANTYNGNFDHKYSEGIPESFDVTFIPDAGYSFGDIIYHSVTPYISDLDESYWTMRHVGCNPETGEATVKFVISAGMCVYNSLYDDVITCVVGSDINPVQVNTAFHVYNGSGNYEYSISYPEDFPHITIDKYSGVFRGYFDAPTGNNSRAISITVTDVETGIKGRVLYYYHCYEAMTGSNVITDISCSGIDGTYVDKQAGTWDPEDYYASTNYYYLPVPKGSHYRAQLVAVDQVTVNNIYTGIPSPASDPKARSVVKYTVKFIPDDGYTFGDILRWQGTPYLTGTSKTWEMRRVETNLNDGSITVNFMTGNDSKLRIYQTNLVNMIPPSTIGEEIEPTQVDASMNIYLGSGHYEYELLYTERYPHISVGKYTGILSGYFTSTTEGSLVVVKVTDVETGVSGNVYINRQEVHEPKKNNKVSIVSNNSTVTSKYSDEDLKEESSYVKVTIVADEPEEGMCFDHWEATSGVAIDNPESPVAHFVVPNTNNSISVTAYYKEAHQHNFNKQVVDTEYLKSAKTCTSKALYYYSCDCGAVGSSTFETGDEPTGHLYYTWVTDTTAHWHSCAKCDEVCDYQEHDGIWIVDSVATEEMPGSKTLYCSVCDELLDTAIIPMIEAGHTHDFSEKCINQSYHWWACECGEISGKEEHTKGALVVEKEGTEDEDGYKTARCTNPNCNAVLEYEAIHIHKYELVSNASTHYEECRCEDIRNEASHATSDWIVDYEAKPLKTGLKHKECTVCGYVIQKETIPALPCSHSNLETTNEVKANCTQNGVKEYHYCPDCERYFSDKECTDFIISINEWLEGDGVIQSNGSHYFAKVEEVKPTKKSEGVKEYYICNGCGDCFEDEDLTISIPNLEEWKATTGKIEKLKGISGGVIALIVIGSVVVLAAIAYFVLGFTLYKNKKLSGKFFEKIYCWIK